MSSKKKRPSFYKLTPSAVQRLYDAGMLTPKGAIYLSVASSKMIGEPYRHKPEDLCRQFGFDKSTYYRKLNELKIDKWLDFSVEGYVHAWRPNADADADTDLFFLGELSHSCDSQSQQRDKKSHECDSQSQQRDKKSQQRDKKTARSRSQTATQAPSLDLDLDLLDLSLDPSPKEGERDTDIEPDFREWLIKKASLLPQQPALLEQWIQKQSKIESNNREFREYQALRERANVPPPAAANFSQPEQSDEQRITTLNHWLAAGDRTKVERLLAANPEWHLAIGAAGVEVCEK